MWTEILLTVLLMIWFLWVNKKPLNYPPGPWGLPLFGYLPIRLSNLETDLSNLRKKYGKIFSWRIGSKLYVFFCEAKIIKELYQNPQFANRPNLIGITLLEDGNKIGVIGTNGFHWHSLRRFMMRHLRDHGMGKSKLASAIQHEALELVNVMKKDAGRATPITKALKPAVINVLWQMVAGKRYELDDENVIMFETLMTEVQENVMGLIALDIFPWIHTILPSSLLNKITKKDHYINLSNLLKQNFKEYINEHIASLDSNNPKDFIDAYLLEMEKNKSDPDSPMSYEDLVGCLADFFLAGLETTALTINFAILYAIKFPEIQRRLHKEIDSVLSKDSLVNMEDKASLPYTEAFIHELLRYSSLVPYGSVHTVLNDTSIGNYVIPKDAIIFATAGEIHFDLKYYESPKEFRPERFLDTNGKLEIPKEGFLPFGLGKRQCLGESLARMELLIFLTTIFQHLEFSTPPGKEIDIRPMDMPFLHSPRREQDILITVRT